MEFDRYIKNLYEHETVKKMESMTHHLNHTCMDHSLFVSYLSYVVCKKFGWDSYSAARAGLLHDLFLYDWKKGDPHEGLHGFAHPKVACKNAEELCNQNENEEALSELEKDIILKHMWPLGKSMPKYKESYVVCIADKVCAMAELLFIFKFLKFKRAKSHILKERKRFLSKQKLLVKKGIA